MVPKLKLKTGPAQNVVSLQSLKDFLRIDSTDDDAMLTTILNAAEKRLEKEAEIKFVNQTWEVFYDAFPGVEKPGSWWDGTREGAIGDLYDSTKGEITLPFGPLSSVNSITYYLADGTSEVFDSSNYVIDEVGYRGRIRLNHGATWPSALLRTLNAVNIDAVFGFGNGFIPASDPAPSVASEIPADIQSAVLNLSANLYEHRGDEMPEIPASVLMLIEDYVRYKI